MDQSSNLDGGRVSAVAALVPWGVLALACYAVHGGWHVTNGRWYELLWACHLGAVAVGVGLLFANATLNGLGLLLLCLGTPLWLADVAAGGEFFPTSLLTHVVAPAIGLYGAWRIGFPRGTWWKAGVVLVGLIGLCRLVTPPAANVNVAFAIQPPWEDYFPTHQVYLICIIPVATAYFWIVEQVLRRVFKARAV